MAQYANDPLFQWFRQVDRYVVWGHQTLIHLMPSTSINQVNKFFGCSPRFHTALFSFLWRRLLANVRLRSLRQLL